MPADEPQPALTPTVEPLAPVLSYATPTTRTARTSKLAVASVFTSIVTSPCFWSWAFDWFPGPRSAPYAMPCTLGVALITLAVPVTAIVRIRRSRGERTGTGVAAFALFLWLLFWGVTGIMFYILATMAPV